MSQFAGRFSGRTAVITGGASGLGKAVAQRIAGEGGEVALWDVNRAALNAARNELAAAHFDEVDVSDHEAVDRMADAVYQRFGAVHVLANNAGISTAAYAWETTLADWNAVLGVNLMGAVHGIRAFLPRMITSGEEGHITCVSSMGDYCRSAEPVTGARSSAGPTRWTRVASTERRWSNARTCVSVRRFVHSNGRFWSIEVGGLIQLRWGAIGEPGQHRDLNNNGQADQLIDKQLEAGYVEVFDAATLVRTMNATERWHVRLENGASALTIIVEGCTYTTWIDGIETTVTLDTFAAVRGAVTPLVASAIDRGFLPVRKREHAAQGAYVENAVLEAACRAAPDDAATWAVYADWLQEHGDPRGELASLVRQGREDLAGIALPHGVMLTKWRHGFPIAARFDLVDNAEALLALPIARCCEELEYRETWEWRSSVASVVESPVREHIRALLFATSRNTDGDLSGVWELPRLEHLRAHVNVAVELGSIRAAALKRFDRRFDEVTDREIATIASADWPALEHLQLEIQSGLVRDFTRTLPIYNARTFPRVRHLAIGGVPLRARTLAVFLATPMVAQLRTLDLSKADITREAIARHADQLRHLESIKLPR